MLQRPPQLAFPLAQFSDEMAKHPRQDLTILVINKNHPALAIELNFTDVMKFIVFLNAHVSNNYSYHFYLEFEFCTLETMSQEYKRLAKPTNFQQYHRKLVYDKGGLLSI